MLWPVALMLLLGLACLNAVAQAQPGTGGKGDYYPLLPGTRWEYRVQVGGETKGSITEVVAAIETINNLPLARLESQVQGKVVATEHLRATPQGVFRHRAQGSEVKVPVPVLRYPVKANDSWEFDTSIGQERVKGKVSTRFEEVEVPLGKFKALVRTSALNWLVSRCKAPSGSPRDRQGQANARPRRRASRIGTGEIHSGKTATITELPTPFPCARGGE